LQGFFGSPHRAYAPELKLSTSDAPIPLGKFTIASFLSRNKQSMWSWSHNEPGVPTHLVKGGPSSSIRDEAERYRNRLLKVR